MNKSEQILVGITEAHSTADTGLKIGSGAAHVECYHTLVLVPYINHSVDLVIFRLNSVDWKQILPVVTKLLKCFFNIRIGLILRKHLLCRLLVDDAFWLPFILYRILAVAENEDIWFCLPGLQVNIDLMNRNGWPAVSDGTGALTLFAYYLGIVVVMISSEESVSWSIETVNLGIYWINSVMITALPVLCLVIDRRVNDFNLPCWEVSLEVFHIIIRIPETPLHVWEEFDALGRWRVICKFDLTDLTCIICRNEWKNICFDIFHHTFKTAVSDTMAAFIHIKFGLGRLPSGIPYAITVLDIEIFTVCISGNTVITVPGKP